MHLFTWSSAWFLLSSALLLSIAAFAGPDPMNRYCEQNDDDHCWEASESRPRFRFQGFRLSAGCFVAVDGSDSVLADLKIAVTRVGSKFRRINKLASQELESWLNQNFISIDCEISSKVDQPCAETVTSAKKITLFLSDNSKCRQRRRTLFHELLHLTGTLENLNLENHNRGSCAHLDAIYACADLVFSELKPRIQMTRTACLACVSSAKASFCDRFQDNYDSNYFNCLF